MYLYTIQKKRRKMQNRPQTDIESPNAFTSQFSTLLKRLEIQTTINSHRLQLSLSAYILFYFSCNSAIKCEIAKNRLASFDDNTSAAHKGRKEIVCLNLRFDFPKINTLFIHIQYTSVSIHNPTVVDRAHVNNICNDTFHQIHRTLKGM